MFTHTTSGKNRLTAAFKVGAVLVVLALVTIAIESPRLIGGAADAAAKAGPTATSQDMSGQPMPPSTSEYSSWYFPAQFPAPKGESEELPATF